jgi:hypothetical protein
VLFNKKIVDSFLVSKKESTLVAYPAYYSITSSLTPSYTWFVNSDVIKTGSNSLTFTKTKDNEVSLLDITIKNPKSLLQTKTATYEIDTTTQNSVVFGESAATSSFGN